MNTGGGNFLMKKKSGGLVRKINFADAVIVFILLLFTCLALYPFIYTVAGSFNDGIDFEYGGVWVFSEKIYSCQLSGRLFRRQALQGVSQHRRLYRRGRCGRTYIYELRRLRHES